MKVQKSIEIAAPPEKIWPFLVVPSNILKWLTTFQKCEFSGQQQSGVGMTLYVEEKAGGPYLKIHFVVTEWVEYQKLAFKMTSGNFVKGYDQQLTIEPIPSGSRFNITEDVKMPWGIFGRLIGFLGHSGSEKHLKEAVNKLKSLAEA
jgi:uncharacterized protein YndB with AHSA1/START domain